MQPKRKTIGRLRLNGCRLPPAWRRFGGRWGLEVEAEIAEIDAGAVWRSIRR